MFLFSVASVFIECGFTRVYTTRLNARVGIVSGGVALYVCIRNDVYIHASSFFCQPIRQSRGSIALSRSCPIPKRIFALDYLSFFTLNGVFTCRVVTFLDTIYPPIKCRRAAGATSGSHSAAFLPASPPADVFVTRLCALPRSRPLPTLSNRKSYRVRNRVTRFTPGKN